MSQAVSHTGEQEQAMIAQQVFAEIIIPLALPLNYTWAVPDSFKDSVIEGCRVEVNLGKNKKYAGIVKRLFNEKPELFEPKPILNLLDTEPVIYGEQLQLWEWLSSYYMCSEGEVMAAALPAHLKLSSETRLIFNDEYGDNFSELDHDEYLVAEALLIAKELNISEVQQVLDSSHVYPVINRLIRKKVCFVWESLKQSYAPKKEIFVLLNPIYSNEDRLADLLNNWSRAPKQMELLLSYLHLLKTEGEVTKPALLKKSNASGAQLQGLIDKNIIELKKRLVDRIKYLPREINIDFTLTPAQSTAFAEIREKFNDKQVCLLHGITSSGKTQVYIRLIEEMIRNGKQVLYMLPEIALTSQVIRRLQKHFGGHIGIYHSKFNNNERVEIWNKVKDGQLQVVVGARSSVFLPFNDLGLVICDEEHDISYKQHDPAPRYNGRDAAIFLASLFDAKVLLGSATPSVETYFSASTGKFGLVELNQRFGEFQLPPIELVDTRKIVQADRSKISLSPQLKEAIEHSVSSGKQVILFQNRRGYSPYQICSACGWIPKCKYCEVSLTYHKLTHKLNCHYCGSTYPPLVTCMVCGTSRFLQKNFGTEKVEEILQENFPELKIARMDIDSVRGKHAHDVLIQQFEQQKIQVLVGTQMVVKGLDFDNVALVGILDADGLLHFADFRVNERAFQLIEQVSGRAGRKESGSRVIVQTMQPQNLLLQTVQQHDYRTMFREELESRKRFAYPPYSRLIHITFRHKLKDIVERGAFRFAESLQNKYGNYMVGPAEPVIPRIRNLYLMELLFKLPRDSKLIAGCKKDLLAQAAMIQNEKSFRSLSIVYDVDKL